MNAVDIQGLTKTYKNGTQALRGVDLAVEEGDFFALLGANGAGKTTIIGILTSLVNKSGGSAKVFGFDLDKNPSEAKNMVGVVPQEFNFSIFEKVIDIVVSQAGYFGVPRKEAYAESEKLLKQLELWDKRNVVARTLSGGMKRRLMIARALVHKPKLLILDEPTAGVDVELRYGMWEFLKELNKSGVTILLTTHYLEEAEQLCRNVAIIKTGEIIKQGSVRELLSAMDSHVYVVNIRGSYQGQEIAGYEIRVVDDNVLEIEFGSDKNLNDLLIKLNEVGLHLDDIKTKGNRLEQLFLNIVRS